MGRDSERMAMLNGYDLLSLLAWVTAGGAVLGYYYRAQAKWDRCYNCGQKIRTNKLFLGDLHICDG